MRLSDLLSSQVSNRTRTRGTEYFAAGAVTHIERRDGIIHATVRGEQKYEVWIEPVGSRLLASCTCPHFIDHFQICKHIWAAVLLAEKRGIPLIEPGAAPANLTLEPVDLDNPYDGEDDDDDGVEFDDDTLPWSPPVAPAPPVRTVPVWQQQLSRLATVPQIATGVVARTPPREGQLLYVLDIDASLAASDLVVELMTRDRKANGEWGKPRAGRVLASDIRSMPPGPDRIILERLLGARPHYDGSYGYDGYGELFRFRLHGVLAQEVLPLFCADERCWARVRGDAPPPPTVPGNVRSTPRRWEPMREKPSPPTYLPLQLDEGPAWRFQVTIRRDDAAGTYTITGSLARDEQRLALSDVLLTLSDGMLITKTHVARLDHHGAFGWLAALRQTGTMTVPLEARPALVDALLAQAPPVIEAPADLHLDVEDVRPVPTLKLTPLRYRPDRLLVRLLFDYDGLHIGSSQPSLIVRTTDAKRIIRRDLRSERTCAERLHDLGCRQEWVGELGEPATQLAAQTLPRVVRTLLAEGWRVEAKGVRYRQPSNVAVAVSSGIDWFDLEGHADYDGERVALPALLAAARRGDGFVTLGDGSMGLLPEDWLRKHSTLASLGTADGDRLRFRRSQAALLDALLAAQPEATFDETFARARRELVAFDGIAAVDPPASFAGALRGYQREGLGWLLFLRRFGFGGCLADDMGLGKTVMVLALLARLHAEQSGATAPALVVAPRSLVFNWRQEAARFAPHLRVLEYTGNARAALRDRIADHDLVLTTYGTLRRDAAHLAAIAFEYVVLDESQAIKNAASASAKAVRLVTAAHRLALSGTPIENHLGELWSLFEFLNPGLLGSASVFAQAGNRRLDEVSVSMLARGLRPFILRRTKEQVAPELPAKTEQTLYCELERPQRALYDELRDHYRHTLLARVNGDGFGRAKLQVLEALLRLRQAACHPGLIDATRSKEASAKLDVLIPHVLQALEEQHKTLVFSQFTSLLAILRARLDAEGVEYEYLDGRTRDRESKVVRFQSDPECRLFLISLKAGGVGLNLTAAEYVFLLDPWWNPAVEAQAIDRAHRIGQDRHVFAYRLIAKDTVEERVLELQRNKRTLADAILKADEGLIKALKREDLELLLS
jgi:superfamily II DNA or RNA helicase